jgi:poly(3-hydroxybutyrate) depolymerase
MTAPPAPTGLAIVEKTATTMSIVWNYAAGATSYQVFINGSNIGEVTSEGAYISGLALNTTYSFYVRAKNSVGVSGNSNTVQGTTTARYKGVTN